MTKVWTAEQVAAIVAREHTLLAANAGTGKTSTIVGKVLWLLGEDSGAPDEHGQALASCADPCTLDRIAAITFTEKAAHDLKEKLRSELRKTGRGEELVWQLERAALGTIHSFCGQILREYALRLGIDPTFRVLDEQDARTQQDRIIREVLFERLADDDEEAGELLRAYSLDGIGAWAKGVVDFTRSAFRDLRWHQARYDDWSGGGDLDAARIEKLMGSALDANDQRIVRRCRALLRAARACVERWRAYEQAENVRDFDSLILDARDLLTRPEGAAALQSIRRRYRILIIDEFQDTDGAQRDIAYAIAGLLRGGSNATAAGPQLFLVGDPKQSIYRFRGADVSVWSGVERDLAARQTPLLLSRNFRSDPAIVEFVNSTMQGAFDDTGRGAQAVNSPTVAYAVLQPAREPAGTGGVEWIVPHDLGADEQRDDEAERIAQRILDLVNEEQVVDPKSLEPRRCRFSDIAVLYRARTGLQSYLDAFRRARIPFYEQGPAGLAEKQEILDLLTLLRLIHNPADDQHAFAFLRSPFVGLRDEVLTRMRLSGGAGRYLNQARTYQESGEWYDGGDARIVEIERKAVQDGLSLLREASTLADRIPIDELLEHLLQRSGYREHMLLLEGHVEALANIRSFLRLTEQYRDHTIGAFLELWDGRDEADPGIPRAQLYSRADNVVTFSTIHAAKGLEWPIVFLPDVTAQNTDKAYHTYWSDAQLGPILCPPKDERGTWALRLWQRNRAQELAEEARLLYVATTRARDRLIVAGRLEKSPSFASWLLPGVAPCNVRQLSDAPRPPVREPVLIDLAWLDVLGKGEAPVSTRALKAPPHRWMTSATELMTRERNPDVWELLYQHGVQPFWLFAPRERKEGAPIPERLRGTIIHGVLERIRTDIELAEVLEETIGELNAPELEVALAPGSQYRAALEREIERVIQSAEWRWYVDGEHHRELPFVHLAGPREWRTGSFDLYRPDGWIIDFKTHQIGAERAATEAEHYHTQMRLYREAAAIRSAVRTRLHFTHANVTVDV